MRTGNRAEHRNDRIEHAPRRNSIGEEGQTHQITRKRLGHDTRHHNADQKQCGAQSFGGQFLCAHGTHRCVVAFFVEMCLLICKSHSWERKQILRCVSFGDEDLVGSGPPDMRHPFHTIAVNGQGIGVFQMGRVRDPANVKLPYWNNIAPSGQNAIQRLNRCLEFI